MSVNKSVLLLVFMLTEGNPHFIVLNLGPYLQQDLHLIQTFGDPQHSMVTRLIPKLHTLLLSLHPTLRLADGRSCVKPSVPADEAKKSQGLSSRIRSRRHL